jgi:magnesium transporter
VALPVVDSQGALVGMVTVDDAMDVAEEEYTEDVQKMAGMGALEYSYFGTGLAGMLGKRLPWLVLLLAAQMLTVLALTNFLENFKHVTEFAVLVLFMPLINSTDGNTGSQAAVLMTRGFAVQEMDLGDWTRVLLHEVTRGLIMGIVLGVAGYGTVVLFGRGGQVALAVGLSIVTAVTLANLIGSMLPFLFKRIGLDPAVTSGPFLASLMDLSGIVIYFSIAVAILSALG